MVLSIKVGITSNPFMSCLLATHSKQCKEIEGLNTLPWTQLFCCSYSSFVSCTDMHVFNFSFLLAQLFDSLSKSVAYDSNDFFTLERYRLYVLFPCCIIYLNHLCHKISSSFLLFVGFHEFTPFEESTENMVFCLELLQRVRFSHQ